MHTRVSRGVREPGDGDGPGPGVEGRREGPSTRRSWSPATWWRSTARSSTGSATRLKAPPPGLRRPEAGAQRHAHPHGAGPGGGRVPDPQGRRHAAGGVRGVPRRSGRRGGREGLGGAEARPRRLGARPCRGRPEPPFGLRRRPGRDVRPHRSGRLPRHRGAGGPGRRGAVLLGRRGQADRHGGQRRLPLAGGRRGLGRERRLLARGPRVVEGEARQGPVGARLDRRGGRPVART